MEVVMAVAYDYLASFAIKVTYQMWTMANCFNFV